MGFKFGDTGPQWGDGFGDFFSGVARRDVFRAVPIEGNNVDEVNAFDEAAVGGFGELCNDLRVLAGVAEEFDTISGSKKYKRTVVTTNEH